MVYVLHLRLEHFTFFFKKLENITEICTCIELKFVSSFVLLAKFGIVFFLGKDKYLHENIKRERQLVKYD